MIRNRENTKPRVALDEGGRTVVSIPATTNDHIWRTIDTAEESEEFVRDLADRLITDDGSQGEVVRILESGGYPILLTHWQSLMSNGLGTGLRVLDEVGARINRLLGDRVEWMSFEQIMRTVISDKAAYPKPQLD